MLQSRCKKPTVIKNVKVIDIVILKEQKKKKKNVFDVMPEDGFARKDRKTMTDSLCNDFGKRSESRSYCWKANGQIYIVEPGYPRQRTCLSIKKKKMCQNIT